MAKPILVANWKNRPDSLAAASALLSGLSKKRELYKKLSLFLAPPHVYFESVAKRALGFSRLASQDISLADTGAHTGSVTPDMLKSFGVRLAILGHSEMREMGETDKDVSKKVKIALKSGIIPLVCIGEKTRDEAGDHFEFLRAQIRHSLEGLKRKEDVGKIIIAYEPVWAIGKRASLAPKSEDLTEMVIFIRKVLTDALGRQAALAVPILYGGSVDPVNAESLFSCTGISGFLLGRASLEPEKLRGIAEVLISK